MRYTKLIILVISVSLIISFSGIIIFLINFSKTKLSDDISHWAQFGDYIGGVLNPTLAIINICIFIYLTFTVQSISNNNHEQALQMSKSVALMSMKREELNHFKVEMDKVISDWEVDLANIEKAKLMLYKYNVLEYRMKYLFPNMYKSEINQKFRSDLVNSLNILKKDNKVRTGPSVNVYGMLISELSRMVVE